MSYVIFVFKCNVNYLNCLYCCFYIIICLCLVLLIWILWLHFTWPCKALRLKIYIYKSCFVHFILYFSLVFSCSVFLKKIFKISMYQNQISHNWWVFEEVNLFNTDRYWQQKTGNISHDALRPMGYFVQVVRWGNSDETCLKCKIGMSFCTYGMFHQCCPTCTKYPIGSNVLWEVLHIFSYYWSWIKGYDWH